MSTYEHPKRLRSKTQLAAGSSRAPSASPTPTPRAKKQKIHTPRTPQPRTPSSAASGSKGKKPGALNVEQLMAMFQQAAEKNGHSLQDIIAVTQPSLGDQEAPPRQG